jgi:CBS domain containing-hemolysin-like protein
MDLQLAYRFLIVALIIMANAFFAGAELALLSVRQSRLRQMAAEGVSGAQTALDLLANPERLLSGMQVGVTLSSLGLGWAGEGSMFALLDALLSPIAPAGYEPILHGVSFAISFLMISFLHVVLGEVVPKNLAIEKADRLATLTAPALVVVLKMVSPFATLIERAASAVSSAIGLSGHSAAATHNAEEIKYIVSSSHKHGHIGEFEGDSIQKLLMLGDITAREIMVPRGAFVAVPADADLDHLLKLYAENKYSRMLVYENAREHVIGFVSAKDLIEVWNQRRTAIARRANSPPFDLRRLLRQPLVVPETKPLSQLIDTFRHSHSHLALVVDEFGSVAGMLTLEDVLEQIFGEIEDEHDSRLAPCPVEWTSVELDGTTNILDLEDLYGIEVPSNAGFETLAGFLLFRFGEIPPEGASVDHELYRFTVTGTERNRITKVLVTRLSPPEEPDTSPVPQ